MRDWRDWLRTTGGRLLLQLTIFGLVVVVTGGMSRSAMAQDDPSLSDKARRRSHTASTSTIILDRRSGWLL